MAKLPDPEINSSIITRFWAKVQKGDEASCWPWTGHRASQGYGQIWLGNKYRAYGAHRLSLIIAGKIPEEGQIALHRCDNPSCVNPDHLRWGTYSENAQDRQVRGRGDDRHGERHPMAQLSAEDVLAIRSSTERQCELAKRYQTSAANICQILSGRRWKQVADLRREGESEAA